MSNTTIPTDFTVGEISRRLRQPVHRVEYLIRSRRIRPVRESLAIAASSARTTSSGSRLNYNKLIKGREGANES